MTSQAQINANRRNAQKSTGPRTDKGKAVVSQNAVKHGLFARDAVIHGESQADFELHREALLGDLRPVGAMERMLAERIVSLSWRLMRAERMQNEAIDEKILECAGGRVSRVTRSLLPKGVRQTLADSGAMNRDPSLGRVLAKDSMETYFFGRLLTYERRIESSMFRTIAELRKLRRLRKAEQAVAGEQPPVAEDCQAQRCGGNLKKQTQSVPAQVGVKPYIKEDYGRSPATGARKNKANRSQSVGGSSPIPAASTASSSKLKG